MQPGHAPGKVDADDRDIVGRSGAGIIAPMSAARPAASIIVPTFREAANVESLVERVFAATRTAGIDAELIIVDDDSRDGIDTVVEALASRYAVRLIVRHGARGLSGAVLRGFAEARSDRFVVLDADLQHPPELVPALLAKLDDPDCDFVLGTRYGRGGRIVADWPWRRRMISRIATWLATPLAPLSDPMSGFFALPRSTWTRARRLDPIGYKIGLELYVKGRCRGPAEVAIQFDTRAAGTSKFDTRETLRFVRHLARLYRFRYPWLVWAAILCAVGIAIAVVRR
ncbi:MAG: polyprenol monophosphomannose synthase [Phycisphaerae bacterium]